MDGVQMIFKETRRLFCNRIFLLLFAVTVTAPLAGHVFPLFILAESETTRAVLAPVKLGALIAAIAYAVFTIYEADRMYRSNVAGILEAMVGILRFNAAKTGALILAAVCAVLATTLLHLPWTLNELEGFFNLKQYLFAYLLILLPAVVFSILISTGLYLLVRRMDVSLLLYGALFYLSYNSTENYLLPWIQTGIPAYSDLFGDALAYRTGLWNRLVWLLISGGVFVLGLWGSRRYEKGVLRSAWINARRAGVIPVLFLLLAVGSACGYGFEPYYDDSADMQYELISNKDTKTAVMKTVMTVEKNEAVKLTGTHLTLEVDTARAEVWSKGRYLLRNTSGVAQEVTFSIQPGHTIRSLRINGAPAGYEDLHVTQYNGRMMKFNLPAEAENTLEIELGGRIEGDRLLQNTLGLEVIGDEYVYLAGNALGADLYVDARGNVTSGQVTLPAHLALIVQGPQNEQIGEDAGRGTKTWGFHTSGRGPLTLIAGSYQMQKISAGGIQIEFYYHPKHAETVRKIRADEVIREAIDYFTATFGPLDYKNVPLKIVEAPVLMMGGIAAGNISFIGESILMPSSFARSDAATGRSAGVEVLVHEICHQWWGIGVYFPFTEGGAWSSEGLTVYSTYKFMKYKYGEAFANENGPRSWNANMEMLRRSFYYRQPQYLDVVPSGFLFDILSTNNMIVIYDKMALMIQKAETTLGEEKFARVLAKLFRRYKNGLSYEVFLFNCGLSEAEVSVD